MTTQVVTFTLVRIYESYDTFTNFGYGLNYLLIYAPPR